MFEDMKKNIDVKDRAQITDYLNKLLNKEAFDGKGLIYGMGHAIYSISDPRAEILQSWAKELAVANGYEEEYELYTAVAEIAPDLIAHKRKMYKGVSPNVDFYSGLVYKMLDLPGELFTPLFAIARIAGWSAHRIEEIQNNGKIIRPAYLSVKAPRDYTQMKDR
jgi:citrate synthase